MLGVAALYAGSIAFVFYHGGDRTQGLPDGCFVVVIGSGGFVCLLSCIFPRQCSQCSPGCPGIHSLDQAGLELRYLLASASSVLVIFLLL